MDVFVAPVSGSRPFRLCRILVTFGCVLVATAGAVRAQTYRQIATQIRRQVQEGRIPSLAVAVSRGDKILWQEAFGWADREQQIAATPHTRFSLASVSKPLTATGLMVLVERGQVDLDRPVNDYLGDVRLRAWVGDEEAATVRRVADHTSGLPPHHEFFLPQHERPWPPVAETIRRYGNLVREPAERFVYSNLGYGVLEHLIAQVSGRSFDSFMREAVFEPLGLEHTAVLQDPSAIDGVAVRYGADGRPVPFYVSTHGGGSGVFSCVHDLLRFAMFHLGVAQERQATILSRRSRRAMRRPSSQRPGGSGSYGLGWSVYQGVGRPTVMRHDGGMPGASATLVLIPAEKIAVAVLAGSRSELPQWVASKVISLSRPRRRWTGGRTPEGPAGRRRPPRRLRATWSGSIRVDNRSLPLTLVLERRESRGRLGKQAVSHLWGVRFKDGYLRAWMAADLDDPEKGHPQSVRFFLKLRGGRLGGSATAFSTSPDGLPKALSYWTELERRGEPASW